MKQLLTSKLFLSTALIANVYASTSSDVVKFLKDGISKNNNIKDLQLKVVSKEPLENSKIWDAYIIEMSAKAYTPQGVKDISTRNIYFVNGDYITTDLTNMKTKKNMMSVVTPKFEKSFYKKDNLIYGNANATHKVAIFSDPLCPFCVDYVPEALKYLKKYPKSFAVYYYDFPLTQIHPASNTIIKAAIVATTQGVKDVTIKMYDIFATNLNERETNTQKILDVFNKKVGSKVTLKDIEQPYVAAHMSSDAKIASIMMVRGTPSIFFDGVKDNTREAFKKVKVIK
ncbi:MAG: thioredoxin domain-containing protein [Campylobacterota bacterium]|nr:thioredoxin domain-containing protein [Campylobacterota bacterium]